MHHRLTPEAAELPCSSADVFGRGLYDHCSITHWKWRDSRKKGFQPASSSLPLLPSASPHLPLPTGFSTVLRFLWVNTALVWHSHNACEIQGVMQTHLNMQHLLF